MYVSRYVYVCINQSIIFSHLHTQPAQSGLWDFDKIKNKTKQQKKNYIKNMYVCMYVSVCVCMYVSVCACAWEFVVFFTKQRGA